MTLNIRNIRQAAIAATFACAFVLPVTAAPQDPASTDTKASSVKTKGGDQKFVTEAAQGGMAEVKLGELAAQKASSDDVKKFGQRMVDDHTKANDQLKALASQKGITLPTDIGSKNQALYDQLSKLSGSDFERSYIQHMTSDHKKDVSEFQKEANNGKDADVKAFAAQTLPTLQDHLKSVQEIKGKLAGSESADRMKQQK